MRTKNMYVQKKHSTNGSMDYIGTLNYSNVNPPFITRKHLEQLHNSLILSTTAQLRLWHG
jgi:hypothetical protein